MRRAYRIFAGLLLAGAAIAQVKPGDSDAALRYGVYREASLSGAVSAVTVQSTSTARRVYFEAANVYCSVACTVTVEAGGTAATTTAATTYARNGGGTAAAAAYHTSNAGAGTTLTVVEVPAGSDRTIDLSGLVFGLSGTRVLTVKTSSITGTARTTVLWGEAR